MAGLLIARRQEADGNDHGPCKLYLCMDLSLPSSKQTSEITRIGLQDDMTFKGSAAALNRSWGTIGRSRPQTP